MPREVAGPGVVGFERGRRHRRGERVVEERGLGLAERLLIGCFQGRGFGFLHLGLPVDHGQKLLLEPTVGGVIERQRGDLVFDPEPPGIDGSGQPWDSLMSVNR